MNITDITLSDSKILSMELDLKESCIRIVSETSYNISQNEFYGETEIQILNWKNLEVKKYFSEQPFTEPTETSLNLESGIEYFNIIQKIKYENTNLSLEGFSRDTDSWLIYEFINPIIKIDISSETETVS